MVKMKVYELAKELGVESKDVIRIMKKYGYEAKSHMSTIEDSILEKVKEILSNKKGTTANAPTVQSDGAFVPRVKRIPKAQVAEEVSTVPDTTQQPAEETKDISKTSPKNKQKSLEEEKTPIIKQTEEPTANRQEEKPSTQKEPFLTEEKPVQHTNQQNKNDNTKAQFNKMNNTQKPAVAPTPEVSKPAFKNNKQPNEAKDRSQGIDKKPYQNQQNKNTKDDRRVQGQNQSGRPQNQSSRPQNQSSRPQNQSSRPQNQSSRPQNQSSRPQNQGEHRGQGQNNRSNTRPLAVPPPPVSPVLEKPTSNYRPEKKNFTKDKVFERVSNEELNRGKRLNNNQKYRGSKNYKRSKETPKAAMPPVAIKKITIGETVVLGELAKSMGKTASELIKKLFELGVMATINQEIDSDTAILLATEFGITVEFKADKSQEIIEDTADNEVQMIGRPPVVTVMGHVDHGKTSLLDAIRKTNVIATEAGGITQHIGAYQVEINNKKITFLDTPGHEAFTAMRARGAQITDISIVVVASDDGVMPQTIEAINHSKAAGVPIIIAINKIDKPEANPDRVKQELTEYGLLCEEWGGDTIMVPVSAKKGLGIENLLEMILLVAEMGDLKANPDRQARGTVVESQLDKSRGAVATLLVQKGTLHIGDNIIAGPVFCKVRAMNDDKGRKIKSAGPSVPVEVLGFSDVPSAGEIFIAVEDEKDARMVASKQQVKRREEELRKSSKVSLDDLFKQIEEGEIKELNLIIKGDVHGSIEAIQQSLVKLNTNEVKVTVIHSGVGGIRESDVMLASASNAIIIGFNVRPDAGARKAAETEAVDIRLYRVIYDALEDVKKAMAGLLAPEFKEHVDGHAQVRETFKVPKVGTIAGCYVTDGKILRNSQVRIIRDNIVIMEGKIESLRRFKDDVKEVATGFECGIGIENFNDIKDDDIIEAFSMEEVEREL